MSTQPREPSLSALPPGNGDGTRSPSPHVSRTSAASLTARSCWRRSGCTCGRLKGELAGLLLAAAAVAALEALDAATGVHQLLLARVEGMALVAQLHLELRLGRARGERVPVGALHGGLDVVGMDLGLHGDSILSDGSRSRTHGGAPVFPGALRRITGSWRSRRGTRRCSWWSGSCPSAAPDRRRPNLRRTIRSAPGAASTPAAAGTGRTAAPRAAWTRR